MELVAPNLTKVWLAARLFVVRDPIAPRIVAVLTEKGATRVVITGCSAPVSAMKVWYLDSD
jgi:hypothetical protein